MAGRRHPWWPLRSILRRIVPGDGRSSVTGRMDMASGTDVVLPGPAMVGLTRAVAALGELGLDGYVIVGGIAVTARLGQAHRATADVDTVIDEVAIPDAIEA